MKKVKIMAKKFDFTISKCSNFQQKTVKDIYNKLYVEDKNKVVLADEVGMGKTYVCRGLCENMDKQGLRTIFYIAPNDGVAKQNHKELSTGFPAVQHNLMSTQSNIKKLTTRLSAIEEISPDFTGINNNGKYCIRSVSATMFFNLYAKTLGIDNERQATLCFLFQLMMHFQENKNSVNVNAINLYVQNFYYACTKVKDKRYNGSNNIEADCRNFLKLQYNNCGGDFKKDEFKRWDYKELSPEEANWAIAFLEEKEKITEKVQKIKGYINLSTSPTTVLPYFENTKFEEFKTSVYESFNNLRKMMNIINIQRVKPDLIILDEFHKYFNEALRDNLDEYLKLPELKNTKVIFVSATPYKMKNLIPEYLQNSEEAKDDDKVNDNKTTDSEEETCFNGYSDLYDYISGSENKDLADHLKNITNSLEKLQKVKTLDDFEKKWQNAKTEKDKAQKILREYIVRTERHTLDTAKGSNYKREFEYKEQKYIKFEAEQTKMLYELFGNNFSLNLNYSKMTPYPLSFSVGYTTLELKEKDLSQINQSLFWDGLAQPNHFRYQALLSKVFTEDIAKALWVPASNVKEEELVGFWKNVYDYSKTLVFARFSMTTKSISALLSQKINALGSDCLCDDILTFDKNDKNDEILEIFENVFKKTDAKKLCKAFYKYLERNRKVLCYAGVRDKNSLVKYCENGQLEETLKEYVFVLTKGRPIDKGDIDTIKIALTGGLNKVEYYSGTKKDGNTPSKLELETKKITCSFAERYSNDKTNGEKTDTVQIKFNSPFYPFVLSTTAIAQEGLNLHNYCHKIFHWKTPISPVDFEQREGRINRFRNHAVRKSMARNNLKPTWTEIFGVNPSNNGLSPNWIADVDNPVKLQSFMINHPLSKDMVVYHSLEKALESYRVSLGYGVNREVLDKIQENADVVGVENLDFKEILLNLAPLILYKAIRLPHTKNTKRSRQKLSHRLKKELEVIY